MRSHSALCVHLMYEHEKTWAELKENAGALAILEHAEELEAVMSDLEFRTTKPSGVEGAVLCNICGQDVLCRNVVSHFTGARSKCGNGLTKEIVAEWWAAKDAHPLKSDRFYRCVHGHLHRQLSDQEAWLPGGVGNDDPLGAEDNLADDEEMSDGPPAASDAISSDERAAHPRGHPPNIEHLENSIVERELPSHITLDLVDAELGLYADNRGIVYRLSVVRSLTSIANAPQGSEQNLAGNRVAIMRPTSKAKSAPAHPPNCAESDEQLGHNAAAAEAPGSQQSIERMVSRGVAAAFKAKEGKISPEPQLAIKTDYVDYQWSEGDLAKERLDCPIEPDCRWDFSLFAANYKESVNEKTMKNNVEHLQKFIALFDVQYESDEVEQQALADPTWFIGFLAALGKGGFIKKAFGENIMDDKRGWSRKALSQMNKLVAFAVPYMLSHDFTLQAKHISDIQMTLRILTTSHTISKVDSTGAAMKTAEQIIDELPETKENQEGILQSMCDLWHLRQRTEGNAKLKPREMVQRNTLLIGIAHFNGDPGRCKELFKIETAELRKELVEAGKDYVACQEHKTKGKYRAAVKVFANGTVDSFKIGLSLPGCADEKLFLPSPTGAPGQRTCRDYLKLYSTKYWGRDLKIGSNTNRKKVAVWSSLDECKKYRQLVSDGLYHTMAAHDGNYLALSDKQKARRQRALLEQNLNPVAFPTEAELKEMQPKWFASDPVGKKRVKAELAPGPSKKRKLLKSSDDTPVEERADLALIKERNEGDSVDTSQANINAFFDKAGKQEQRRQLKKKRKKVRALVDVWVGTRKQRAQKSGTRYFLDASELQHICTSWIDSKLFKNMQKPDNEWLNKFRESAQDAEPPTLSMQASLETVRSVVPRFIAWLEDQNIDGQEGGTVHDCGAIGTDVE